MQFLAALRRDASFGVTTTHNDAIPRRERRRASLCATRPIPLPYPAAVDVRRRNRDRRTEEIGSPHLMM
jgi:hypothetical protein